jgi:hypothetical protein
MLTKEQIATLSECIGYIDALASMEGQNITISDAVCDMLCDLSTELMRLRKALTEEGEETPLPGVVEVLKELPLESKPPLTPMEKMVAIDTYCMSQPSCASCPLFGRPDNGVTVACGHDVEKADTFFDCLVENGKLTPDGKLTEED